MADGPAPRAGASIRTLAGFGADGRADPVTAQAIAAAWLAGGLVALPTETVYGLAADAEDPRAVARIYAAKGRPADHPLIVHVADAAALRAWSAQVNPAAEALAARFWPGPLTVVVRRSPRAGDHLTGGQDTVALRCPGHPVALAALRALGAQSGDPARGVAAPSANRFGRVSPTRAADVLAELGEHLDPTRDLVIEGGASAVGVESTIVDCTAQAHGRPQPRVLRPGAISQAQIDAVLAGGTLDRADNAPGVHPGDGSPPPGRGAVPPASGSAARSGSAGPLRAPGLLDSHYAPTARVLVLDPGVPPSAPGGAGAVGLLALAGVATPAGWIRLAQPRTVEEYAHALSATLRRADERGLDTVVAVLPEPALGPLARAVADRLGRAAHRG